MYEIKRAKKRHWPRIRGLIAENPGTLEQKYLPKRKHFFVALAPKVKGNKRELLGCAALDPLSDRLSELRSVASKGNGVGAALIEHCLGVARESDVPQVIAITDKPEYFERFGFHYLKAGGRQAVFLDVQNKRDSE